MIEDNEHQGVEQQPPKVIELNKLRATALAWLGRQEYSIHKFSQKLRQYGACENQVDQVVTEFCQHNWLSETRYCEGFVRARINKGQGSIRILNDARVKQLDQNEVKQALERTEVDWFELALTTYQKRFGLKPIADMKDKAKRLRFMQYRGFSMEQVNYALEESQNNQD